MAVRLSKTLRQWIDSRTRVGRFPGGVLALLCASVAPTEAATTAAVAGEVVTDAQSRPSSEPASSSAKEDDPNETLLFLEVSLNGMPRGLHPFHQRQGELWVQVDVLKLLGFVLPANVSGDQQLSSLPGVVADYDEQGQRVAINAPLATLNLPTTVLGVPSMSGREAPSTSTGLLLNYDLYGTLSKSSSLSAFTEMRYFSGESVFSTTELFRHASGQFSEIQPSKSVRLDSTWSHSFPSRMLTVRLGDTVTGALPWSRSTRIAGVQLARNFGLQPYRQTAPLPSFIGSATLPSEVELFVNGIRQYNGRVPAGPFQLNTLPSVNSSGTAQVVLTDALGRATTIDFSLFDAGRLLASGLTDWTVDVGVVRRNYGLRSFDYGNQPVVTGTWRRGMSDSLTLESHAEGTRGLVLAGVGAVRQLGALGLVSGSVSRSQHREGAGNQASVSWSLVKDRFNAGLSGARTTGDYRDVATQYGSAPAQGSAHATVGYRTTDWGSVNLSYFYLRPVAEASTRYASVNWFHSLSRSASITVGVNQNLANRGDRSIFVGLNWLLDTRTSVGSSLQHDAQSGTMGVLSAQNSAPSEGGMGWRVAARAGGGNSGGQAELNYLGRLGGVQAGVSDYGNGSRFAYAGASGSLVMMGGRGFAARRIDSAFAVVDTDGVADVPVHLENRLIGQTDERGLLLVVPVSAYQTNRLAIDPMHLPADVRIDRAEASITPSDRSGTQVRFGITPVRAANVILVDEKGAPLPLGSRVAVSSRGTRDAGGAHENQQNPEMVVGYDGMVYLDTLDEFNELSVRTPTGLCRASFTWRRVSDGVMHVGPLACLP